MSKKYTVYENSVDILSCNVNIISADFYKIKEVVVDYSRGAAVFLFCSVMVYYLNSFNIPFIMCNIIGIYVWN